MQTSPTPGAIAVVLHNNHLLLAQRGKEPDAGLWGFPGGHVESGETAMQAAARELLEETGIIATPVQHLTNIDVLRHGADGKVTAHFRLVAVLCTYVSGAPFAADDVTDARWVPCDAIRQQALPMSDQVISVMEQAIACDQVRLAAPRA